MAEGASAAERAMENFLKGYNCSQAVVLAFSEKMGLTEEQAARLASALGGGMCRMRESCGALSGAMLVLGALEGYSDPGSGADKARLYDRGQRFLQVFKAQYGSLRCGELLKLPPDRPLSPMPTPRTAEFYRSRPCARIVYDAARLLEEELGRQA